MPTMPQDDFNRLTAALATSSAEQQSAVASLVSSNASLIRSAADADDANNGLSKAVPFLASEIRAAILIDNTVDDAHRGGLPASRRDTEPVRPPPAEMATIARNTSQPLHGTTTWGLGHMPVTPERTDLLNAFHRDRTRHSRTRETASA